MRFERGGPEQRRFPRAAVALPVQYRHETVEEPVLEYAADLGLGGMFIRTMEPLPVGTQLQLLFTHRRSDRLIEAVGRVVHAQEDEAHGPAGMGVAFGPLDAEAQERIQRLVAERNARRG